MALLSAFFEAQLAALYPSRRIEMCGTAGKIGRLLGALLVAGAVVPTQPEANHISQPRMGNVRVEAPPDGRRSFNTNDTITVIFTAYDAGGAAHTVQSFRGVANQSALLRRQRHQRPHPHREQQTVPRTVSTPPSATLMTLIASTRLWPPTRPRRYQRRSGHL